MNRMAEGGTHSARAAWSRVLWMFWLETQAV
jgi:hypothetical protein